MPDVRSSDFLSVMKKSGRVILLGGSVSHRRVLGKPNKMAAFQVALVGDRRDFRHEHAMAQGWVCQLLVKPAGYFTSLTVTPVSGAFRKHLANKALPILGMDRSSQRMALDSKTRSFSAEKELPRSISFTLPGLPNNAFSAGSAARRVP
jgi:hypothetical protein